MNAIDTHILSVRYRTEAPMKPVYREAQLHRVTIMSFALYIFGVLVVLSGAIYGAVLLNVPQQWIIVGSIIIAGIGILSAVASTRSRDKHQ